MPLDRFILRVYGWLTEHATAESREKIHALIFDPPAGITKEAMESLPEWQPENLAATWMSQFAGRVTTPIPLQDVV